MCKPTPNNEQNNRNSMGRAMKTVLAQANVERRLICGLYASIKFLSKYADDALLCILPVVNDATTHMQTVLLQAYCFENSVPVLHVDSEEKLSEFCGVQKDKSGPSEYMCVIVTRDMSLPVNYDEDLPLSPNEQKLTDFYECTLQENPRPVIILPR